MSRPGQGLDKQTNRRTYHHTHTGKHSAWQTKREAKRKRRKRRSVAGSGSFTDAGRTLKCCSKLDLCPASCSFSPLLLLLSPTPPSAFPFAHMPINIFIVRLLSRLPPCHKSCLILCSHNVFPSCTLRWSAWGEGGVATRRQSLFMLI